MKDKVIKDEAIVGLYRHENGRAGKEGHSVLIETFPTGTEKKELLRTRNWKKELIVKLEEKGYNILSVSIAHGGTLDNGVNIVASVNSKPPEFGKRKTATIGKRDAGAGPVKTGKTMAHKRRSARVR